MGRFGRLCYSDLRYSYYFALQKSRAATKVVTWNILLLAALSHSSDTWGSNLFTYFPSFTSTYYAAIRSFTQSGVARPESAAATINHIYVSIKLWLLLAQKLAPQRLESTAQSPSLADGGENSDALMVWNELWPHFDRLVNVLEAEVEGGNISVCRPHLRFEVTDIVAFNSPLPHLHGLLWPISLYLCASQDPFCR
jgi:hypothetical protein